MVNIIKKKIKAVKKRIANAKEFYAYSKKTLGPDLLMARAYTHTIIKHKSELRTLENLLREIK